MHVCMFTVFKDIVQGIKSKEKYLNEAITADEPFHKCHIWIIYHMLHVMSSERYL